MLMRKCGHDKFYLDVTFDLDSNPVKDGKFNADRNQAGAFICVRCCAQYNSLEDIPIIKRDTEGAKPVILGGSDIFTVIAEGDGPSEVDIFKY